MRAGRILIAGIAAVAVTLPGPGVARSVPGHDPIPSSGPCGSMAGQTPAVTKVMVIVMENAGYSEVIGSPSAPDINAAAGACGLASDYHGVQYPSLPNYIDLTAGQAPPAIAGNGVAGSDCHPIGTCVSTDSSVFSQLTGAGLDWRSYAESMPANCSLADAYPYVARHNPAVYFDTPAQRADCASFDVPMGTVSSGALASDLAAGTLPTFSLVVPNVCSDGHDSCGGQGRIAEQNAFFASWLPSIVAAPDYQSGRLAVVLTWDTDSRASREANHVATVVMSPFTPAGTVDPTPYDHFSLLRTIERVAGLDTYLGAAATATDMVDGFHLAAPPAPTITAAPEAQTASTDASLSFADADPAAGFQCSLDGAAYAPCSSPAVYSGLAVGDHAFAVEAVTAAGPSAPATAAWTVLPPTS